MGCDIWYGVKLGFARLRSASLGFAAQDPQMSRYTAPGHLLTLPPQPSLYITTRVIPPEPHITAVSPGPLHSNPCNGEGPHGS